ncbi:hypothetical protein CFC21_007437 [Triticum aestivum]|uniref:Uncharacterized protein n=2 Tax=Triticum aestivum TaxID=4565 RepID=A0A9R1DEI9_WHEAT|nr:protein AUXIN-REGULATED GENE INVOLVED IN ORGAN SIZE-like [Triticum aestivum]KAF6990207.1 hypothetical protein CFC21_007437 [Triticum aestivum]
MSTESRAKRSGSMAGGGGGRTRGAQGKRVGAQGQGASAATAGYFTAELAVLFLCLTALLVFLPLVLPPLPPPPSLLLLVPVGLMAVLLALAFVPSDSRSIASSCH